MRRPGGAEAFLFTESIPIHHERRPKPHAWQRRAYFGKVSRRGNGYDLPNLARNRVEMSSVKHGLRCDSAVKRIEKPYVLGRDQLVFNEDGCGHRLLLKNAESQRNEMIAITFREVSHGTDQAGARTP